VPYSYRGFKALTAQKRGLAALLIYSDPAQDGFAKGDTFPVGPWGPSSHIQRGSITYDFMIAGDPLTPGYASLPGAPRIKAEDALSMPKIIMVPMSYRDAEPMLRALGGPEAPKQWQGALGFTYHVGGGAATTVHVKVDMDGGTRPIYVVEGRIRGTEEPDKYVLLGNHRDAWVFGGVDPSSGTATQLELARVLGTMAKEGERPKRSIVFADWDAEEWHLTGSTEWGENFADDVKANAIAYLNVDASTSGTNFEATAVASLNDVVTESVRDVKDPTRTGSVLDAWGRRDTTAHRPLDYPANALGSGSDYTVFLNFLGVPVVEMDFDGPYGVYHSVYDDYYWMTHFGDPGFKYMTAMSEVWGRMAMRLANADVYPYDFALYADRVRGFIDSLAAQPSVAGQRGRGARQRARHDTRRSEQSSAQRTSACGERGDARRRTALSQRQRDSRAPLVQARSVCAEVHLRCDGAARRAGGGGPGRLGASTRAARDRRRENRRRGSGNAGSGGPARSLRIGLASNLIEDIASRHPSSAIVGVLRRSAARCIRVDCARAVASQRGAARRGWSRQDRAPRAPALRAALPLRRGPSRARIDR
jgi:N-acetylated-alpha-linked acidic dipeptidase